MIYPLLFPHTFTLISQTTKLTRQGPNLPMKIYGVCNVLLMNYISSAIRMKCTLMYADLLFCLLETTVHFINHCSFYYFLSDDVSTFFTFFTLFLITLIINIYCIMKLFLGLSFINCDFYACLLAVRRASARQAALSYLVPYRLGLKGPFVDSGSKNIELALLVQRNAGFNFLE
jgi:hypothetical protein